MKAVEDISVHEKIVSIRQHSINKKIKTQAQSHKWKQLGMQNRPKQGKLYPHKHSTNIQ